MKLSTCRKSLVMLVSIMATWTCSAGVEVWINAKTPAVTSAAGTPNEPYQCPDGTALATVLTSIGENSTIHFMPGTYLVANGITPKSGWKLRGAGIGNTILRLLPLISGPGLAVIGGTTAYVPKDGAEVSDMTVDCNLQNQSVAACIHAVHLSGSNTRISRVRAINWGSTTAGECFTLLMGAPAFYGERTNCVIEDCVVDSPAPVVHTDGTTAISIWTGSEEDQATRTTVGAEIRGCLVAKVTAGSGVAGQPLYFHAYAAGAYGGCVRNNQAVDLIGGAAFYQDTWSGGDVVVANNIFENVTHGAYFNMCSYHMGGIKIIGNVITPAANGTGIAYYNGEPASQSSNAYARNLIIKDNTVHPFRGVTSINAACALNGVINSTVVNNVLDGGESGADFAVHYWQLPRVTLNTFAGNYNLKGTALKMSSQNDYNWRAGYEDVVRFTPQRGATGWYRIVSGNVRCSGAVEVYALDQAGTDNVQTDLEFSYRVRTYTTDTTLMGDINLIRQGSLWKQTSSNGGAVTKARIVSNPTTDAFVYLDIYVAKADAPKEITVKIRGLNRGLIYASPALITQTPAVFSECNF